MAFSGAQITRLGVSGFARQIYGSFADKLSTITAVVRGAGGGRRKRYRWVTIGPNRYKVASVAEERDLLENYVDEQQEKLVYAQAGTETEKARGIKISLTKAKKRLAAVTKAHETERRREEDEMLVMLLTV